MSIRCGIIGSGFGLNAHFPAFASLIDVEVIAMTDSGSGMLQSHMPVGVVYSPSWRHLIEMDLDVVSVATPPMQHYEIVLAALARGKHVFCEKPFGISLSHAKSMAIEAHRSATNVAAVNFQFRYEPGITLLKEKVNAGLIGNILRIDISWMSAGRASPQSLWSWRNDLTLGGGVILAFFCHIADLMCWLVDSEPRWVFGDTRILISNRKDETGAIKNVTAEDVMTAQLEMNNGVLTTCRVSNCQYGGDGFRIEVSGTQGVLSYHHGPPFAPNDQSLDLRGPEKNISFMKKCDTNLVLTQNDSRTFAVNLCVKDFISKIAGQSKSKLPNFQDGLRVQRIIHAIRTSALTQQIVSLDDCF